MAIIEGNGRPNRLLGTGAADDIEGKGGNDRLFGLGGHDILDGDLGNDTIYGGTGNDSIEGGAGSDLIYGGDGNDLISGDEGNDIMNGGAGRDTFVFDSGDGDDRINGFIAGTSIADRLDLRDAAFDFVTLSDVLARATDTAGGVRIDLGAGDSVILTGVREAKFAANDFIL
jgi:Ca2+-binding RTX toxin-like protein